MRFEFKIKNTRGHTFNHLVKCLESKRVNTIEMLFPFSQLVNPLLPSSLKTICVAVISTTRPDVCFHWPFLSDVLIPLAYRIRRRNPLRLHTALDLVPNIWYFMLAFARVTGPPIYWYRQKNMYISLDTSSRWYVSVAVLNTTRECCIVRVDLPAHLVMTHS